MTDDAMIPELALGWARYGGYKAAATLANRETLRDTESAWIVGSHKTGLIRGLTSKKVIEEYGGELAALNAGEPVTADKLSRGGWWKSRVRLAKSEPLAQPFGTGGLRWLDLGGRAFIAHRPPVETAKPVPKPTTIYSLADVYDEYDDDV